MSLHKRKQVLLTFDSFGDLPTLAHIAFQVIAVVSQDNSSMRDVARLVMQDPPLAGRVLRVANSVYYGLRQPVSSISQALVVLGLNRIKEIVSGIAILSLFPTVPGEPVFDRARFWNHSVATAFVSRYLSQLGRIKLQGEEFAAGLLHDLGLIFFDQYFHYDIIAALALQEKQKLPLSQAETRILGLTHPEAGAMLAERWKLPASLVDAIHFHHEPWKAKIEPTLAALVRMAELMATGRGVGFDEAEKSKNPLVDPAWQILTRQHPVFAKLDQREVIAQLDEVLQKAQEFVRLVQTVASEPPPPGDDLLTLPA
ncbi:MAG: HDOD domain-containing protein [Nitrospirae bacterium]|nr:HDOD domain-containing protein [Nitrospirota bacterium]